MSSEETLRLVLEGDDRTAGQALDSVKGKIGGISTSLLGAAAGAAAMFLSFRTIQGSISITQQLGGEVGQLARELGISATEASHLRFAAARSGIDISLLSGSLGILARKLKGVSDMEKGVSAGGKNMGALLKSIGVNALDAHGNILPITQILPQLADKFKAMPDGLEKTALALQIFGRAGRSLLPLLNQGSKGLEELAALSDKLGLTLTGENLQAIKDYGKAQRTWNEALNGLKLQIGLAVMPALTRVVNFLTQAQPKVRAFTAQFISGFRLLILHLKEVVTTGDRFSRFLADMPWPVRILADILGIAVLQLQGIVEGLREAGEKARGFADKLLGLNESGRGAAGWLALIWQNSDKVAGAITAFITALVAGVVLSFAVELAQLAWGFVTFPIKLVYDAAAAIVNFVKVSAGLISKTVTITQNVIRTGSDFLAGLSSIVQQVAANVTISAIEVSETAKEKLQTLFENIFSNALSTALGNAAGEAAPKTTGKMFGLKFGLGMVQGIATAIGAGLGAAIIGAISVVAGVGLATAAGILAIAIAAGVLAFLAGYLIGKYKDEIGHFFAALPGLTRDALGLALGAIAASLAAIGVIAIGIGVLLFRGLRDHVLPPVVNFFTQTVPNFITQTIPSWGVAAFNAIVATLSNFGAWIKDTALPGVITFFTVTVPDEIRNGFPHVRDAVRQLITDIFPAFARWIAEDAIPGVITFFTTTLPNAIADSFGKVWGVMKFLGAATWAVFKDALNVAVSAWNVIKDWAQPLWAKIVEGWNWIATKANMLPGIDLPTINVGVNPARIGTDFPGGRAPGPVVGPVQQHALGGIFTRPHLGMVAERGPEAIIPLGRGNRVLGGAVTVIFNHNGPLMGNDYEARGFARQIAKLVDEQSRGAM